MELPFPGMDPYLEASYLWPDVHSSLIAALRTQLQIQLDPRYIAAITPYVVIERVEPAPNRLVAIPDIAVLERGTHSSTRSGVAVLPAPLRNVALLDVPTRYTQIEIRSLEKDRIVTVIEVLPPANKRPSQDGAEAYERKRQELFNTSAHLLELDLLRGGSRPKFSKPLPDYPYFIFLSRAQVRPNIEVWPLSLREEIPLVPVPLSYLDDDIVLDMGKALKEIYQQAAYERRIDYKAEPPAPELSADDATWLDEHLKNKGLRS
jgi:hypothetical protein